MSNFKLVKQAVNAQLAILAREQLFTVDIPGRDTLVDIYLNSFEDSIERQYHNCNCCKSFIRQYGNIVAIIDGEVHTIWQVTTNDMQYNVTMSALHNYVVNRAIAGIFLSDTSVLGTDFNIAKNTLIRWEHFSYVLPAKHISSYIGTKQSEALSTAQVFHRSLENLTVDSCQVVLDLIAQNSLYRGVEFKPLVESFVKHKLKYDTLTTARDKELYIWANIKNNIRIRNTAIGTLLIDLSEGIELDSAVCKFEAVVAPSNYKRPTTLVTPKMVEKAKTIALW